jgi:hypothetical protein
MTYAFDNERHTDYSRRRLRRSRFLRTVARLASRDGRNLIRTWHQHREILRRRFYATNNLPSPTYDQHRYERENTFDHSVRRYFNQYARGSNRDELLAAFNYDESPNTLRQRRNLMRTLYADNLIEHDRNDIASILNDNPQRQNFSSFAAYNWAAVEAERNREMATMDENGYRNDRPRNINNELEFAEHAAAA